jgi:uncharacterized protein YndB with AHSA1/START domain
MPTKKHAALCAWKDLSAIAGMSDDAVRAATGRDWGEWFAVLDQAGATAWSHGERTKYLGSEHGCKSWWRQMVAVGYERARGLRAKHEKPDGFEISRSRTIGVGVPRLFAAWSDASQRRAWLGADSDRLQVRTAVANKTLRVTWIDGHSHLEVAFYNKGGDKTQVSVQHGKLADEQAAEQAKAYWSEALDRLTKHLTEPGDA